MIFGDDDPKRIKEKSPQRAIGKALYRWDGCVALGGRGVYGHGNKAMAA